MDKKLRAGHAAQDEKIQRLEDEIFTRQTGPPSPPSFVKNAESGNQVGIKFDEYGAALIRPGIRHLKRATHCSYISSRRENVSEKTQAEAVTL